MINKQDPAYFILFFVCIACLFSCRKTHKKTLTQEINTRDSIAVQTYLNKVYHQKIKDTIKDSGRIRVLTDQPLYGNLD
jgi:hypothetical protein